MLDAAISIRNLTKKLSEVTAVDSVSLEIHYSSVFGLLGPNGAGKTTTLRMLAGHLMPTSGSITLCGKRMPEQLAEAKREIGFLSAGMELYDKSVRENLQIFCRLRQIEPVALKRRMSSSSRTSTWHLFAIAVSAISRRGRSNGP